STPIEIVRARVLLPDESPRLHAAQLPATRRSRGWLGWLCALFAVLAAATAVSAVRARRLFPSLLLLSLFAAFFVGFAGWGPGAARTRMGSLALFAATVGVVWLLGRFERARG